MQGRLAGCVLLEQGAHLPALLLGAADNDREAPLEGARVPAAGDAHGADVVPECLAWRGPDRLFSPHGKR